MTRDMDTIRQILLAIEKEELSELELDESKLKYHTHLLVDAGFIEATDVTTRDDARQNLRAYVVHGLTWAGHEFIDAARDDGIWAKAKKSVSKIGSVSMPIWINLLTMYAKRQLGLN